MKFSEVQQKEIIEAGSGRFIGYIIDAEVCEQTVMITAFLVAQPKKFLNIFHGDEPVQKVLISDILVIGKDVILVKGVC